MRDSEIALRRALRIFAALRQSSDEEGTQRPAYDEELVRALFAQRALWLGEPVKVNLLESDAWKAAHAERFERDLIRAIRLQGETALALRDFDTAQRCLIDAWNRAKRVNFVKETVLSLIALAKLRRGQGEYKSARDLLEDVWEPVERGPYPLFHADALNVLAQIERDVGHHRAAVEAAQKAYRLSWCGGTPFAYHWGLKAAREHLSKLGAHEPDDLPRFDESKYEPLTNVAIDLPDEFGAGMIEP